MKIFNIIWGTQIQTSLNYLLSLLFAEGSQSHKSKFKWKGEGTKTTEKLHKDKKYIQTKINGYFKLQTM